MALIRRVYRRELMAALGVKEGWFVKMLQAGKIPRGKTDPGGRREWWMEDEANRIIAALAKEAKPADHSKWPQEQIARRDAAAKAPPPIGGQRARRRGPA